MARKQELDDEFEHHPCGCVSDTYHWIKMCKPCRIESDDMHKRFVERHGNIGPELLALQQNPAPIKSEPEPEGIEAFL